MDFFAPPDARLTLRVLAKLLAYPDAELRAHLGELRAALRAERALGCLPIDVSAMNFGWDIESIDPAKGTRRFIEVKGRVSGAPTITVTRNEILYSLNKPDDFILAIVEFLDGENHKVHYVRRPFSREPDFGVTSVNYDFADLLARAEAPR